MKKNQQLKTETEDNLALILPIDPHDSGADLQPTVAQFNAFTALSEDAVRQLIHDSSKKSCSLDPLPTSVTLEYVDILFTCYYQDY